MKVNKDKLITAFELGLNLTSKRWDKINSELTETMLDNVITDFIQNVKMMLGYGEIPESTKVSELTAVNPLKKFKRKTSASCFGSRKPNEEGLNPNQAKAMAFIRKTFGEKKRAPTRTQIHKLMGYSSTSGIHGLLTQLDRKGMIMFTDGVIMLAKDRT